MADNKYDRNHHHYEFVIMLASEEGLLTMRENVHHHDDLDDAWASYDLSYRRAIDEITALCETWITQEGVDQYAIVAINGDLCWKERLDLPAWT